MGARNEPGQFVNLVQPTPQSPRSAAERQETKFLRHLFLKYKVYSTVIPVTNRIKDFHSKDKCQ